MKSTVFAKLANFFAPIIMVLAMLLAPAAGGVGTAYASSSYAPDDCGQLLADAEAQFLNTLAPDGSVPATPETQAAALEYIRVSKLCYEEIEKQNSVNTLQSETPSFIDDGGVTLEGASSSEFVLTNKKWGSSAEGTTGGTVTYSFMGNGLSLSDEGSGTSIAVTSLPGFKPCFLTEIQNAFAAWQAVSNIKFVQVSDSGSAFDAPGAVGDIRIGAHAFDGVSGTLAHAYYPPPNGYSAAGDVHFDSAENWSCDTSGTDIGIVAMHEIGHSLGLAHEGTSTVALMDPYYNKTLLSLQSDDIHGATTIYGTAALLPPPPGNDNFNSPQTVPSFPYTNTIDDVAGATIQTGEPIVKVYCDGKMLKLGTNTVWYKFTPGSSGLLSMDTVGSNYDTYIAVWTGSTITSLTLAGCDDDNQTSLTSQLSINLTAGVPYYIQVAKYNGKIGATSDEAACGTETYPTCKLVFNIKKQTFLDVPPTHQYYEYIEALYSNGLTGGCTVNPLNYCPSTNLNRGATAVFMIRGNFGSSYSVPPATHFFKDDWSKGTWAEPWAEDMYNNSLSAGCLSSPLKYCPWDLIPREQVVIFALRLKYGKDYKPPAASGTLFADMTNKSYYATPWAEKAYLDGLITNCGTSGGKPMFCPKAIVNRGLAAYVLAKAKSLVP